MRGWFFGLLTAVENGGAGRANEAVVPLLADRLGIDPSSIAVVSGHGSPAKIIAVYGMDDEAIRQAFPPKSPEKPAA